MKINTNTNNSNYSKAKVLSNFNRKKKENNINFKFKLNLRTSKNLEDISKEEFDISNSLNSITINKNKTLNTKPIKGKKISNILLNNFENENQFEKATTYTNHNLRSKSSSNINIYSSKKSIVRKHKTNKKVKFKPVFATIIEIESFKKYNAKIYYNTKCTNCSCLIV